MKISNRAGLPDALIRAVQNDSYNKGDSEFSLTELLKPERQAALEIRHAEEIEVDAEDCLHSLYGQIVHLILERANVSGIAEKRFFGMFGGARVSAQVDTLELKNGVLSDWKFSTAWKFKPGQPPSPDWVAQLNGQLELLRQNGLDAKTIQIVGLIRDFSKLEARRNADYPQTSVVIVPIPLWTREETLAFFAERVRLHREARADLPLCKAEDRWAKPDTWAVIKQGAKRASRVYEREAEALAHAAQDSALYVQHRPGESIRCAAYCRVSRFCSQFAAIESAERAGWEKPLTLRQGKVG